jgi:hypothetical protein
MTSNDQEMPAGQKLEPIKKRNKMKLVLYVLGGAVAGFLYYKFVGCRTGTCPITSSPIISTLYGAGMGFLLGNS